MSPSSKKAIAVPDYVDALLQCNKTLYRWLTDCFSVSQIKRHIWTDAWVESLHALLEKANPKTIEHGYQLLKEELNNQLGQPYLADEDTQNDAVYALLLRLLVMQVYRQATFACHPTSPFTKLQAMPWDEQATQVIKTVPHMVYLNQLNALVIEGIAKKPIPSAVNQALLALHRHTLNFYFQQLLQGLRHSTPDSTFAYVDEVTYQPYRHAICMSQAYSLQLSTLKLIEPEHLAHLLFKQLTQLIESTSTLDLSPSWMERLKQWITACFSKLQLLYKTTPNAVKMTSSALLDISQRLRRLAKKAVQKEKLQSYQLLRERCWFYFSLYELLITQYGDEAKQALNYQSTALALFESFMCMFEWPYYMEKGILKDNPLTSVCPKVKPKQVLSVALKERLIDSALNKLRDDFFKHTFFCWKGFPNPEQWSFIHWLIAQQKSRLMAKIERYKSQEPEEFEEDEIDPVDKRQIYQYVLEISKDFCVDLNQITQMILSVWFNEVGISLTHAELVNILSTPGRWLSTNPVVPQTAEDRIDRFSYYMWEAIAQLGAGIYFFPPLQQRWSRYEKALAAHTGDLNEFLEQHKQIIKDILNKLFLIFHPDHQSESRKKSVLAQCWAQECIPDIKAVKDKLRAFIEQDASELYKGYKSVQASLFVDKFENVVQTCMYCYLRYERMKYNLCSLSEKELKRCYPEAYEWITKSKERDAWAIETRHKIRQSIKITEEYSKEIEVIRKETEAIRKETEAIRKETEAIRKETEAIRKEKEAERQAKEVTQARETEERQAKEAAQARVEALEKELEAIKEAGIERVKALPEVRNAKSVSETPVMPENTKLSGIKAPLNKHTLFTTKGKTPEPIEPVPLRNPMRRSQSWTDLFSVSSAYQIASTATVSANDILPESHYVP